jgi:eukaryotic-like serine/threonine-protein kinase
MSDEARSVDPARAVVGYIREGQARRPPMTDPQDPNGYNPYSYDPLGRVPFAGPPVEPPPFTPPPAPPQLPSVNALATLSLLFAFVFPPAGAILGHLGLARIRRTGELGRDRAVAGVTLSYAFMALTVVALVAWATLAAFTSAPSQTAEPSPTTTTAPPPPPVAPDTVGALLPSLTDLKNITVDQNLEAGPTFAHPGRSDNEGSVNRAECWGSIAPGMPEAYTVDAILGYHAAIFSDTRSFLKSVQVIEAVAAFRDPPTARAQLDKLLSGWRQCGGTTVSVTIPGVGPTPYSLSAPADAGNGITTLDLAPKGLQVRSTRAIAAKANVVIDLSVSYSGTTDSEHARQSVVSIANYILNKIPG